MHFSKPEFWGHFWQEENFLRDSKLTEMLKVIENRQTVQYQTFLEDFVCRTSVYLQKSSFDQF